MTDERKLRAESLVRLTENPDGRLLLSEIQDELDGLMRTVLYCDDNELLSARGHARALYEVLKKFEDAKKAVRGNTHGAS